MPPKSKKAAQIDIPEFPREPVEAPISEGESIKQACLPTELASRPLFPVWSEDIVSVSDEDALFEDPDGLPLLPAELEDQCSSWKRPGEVLTPPEKEVDAEWDAISTACVEKLKENGSGGKEKAKKPPAKGKPPAKKGAAKEEEGAEVWRIAVRNVSEKRRIATDLSGLTSFAERVIAVFRSVENRPDFVPEDCFLWEGIRPGVYAQEEVQSCNPSGKYAVKLHLCGAWRAVVVDDRIPVTAQGRSLFPNASSKNEIWPWILCKALLKAFPRATVPMNVLLHACTGWIPQQLTTEDPGNVFKMDGVAEISTEVKKRFFEQFVKGLEEGSTLCHAVSCAGSALRRLGIQPAAPYLVVGAGTDEEEGDWIDLGFVQQHERTTRLMRHLSSLRRVDLKQLTGFSLVPAEEGEEMELQPSISEVEYPQEVLDLLSATGKLLGVESEGAESAGGLWRPAVVRLISDLEQSALALLRVMPKDIPQEVLQLIGRVEGTVESNESRDPLAVFASLSFSRTLSALYSFFSDARSSPHVRVPLSELVNTQLQFFAVHAPIRHDTAHIHHSHVEKNEEGAVAVPFPIPPHFVFVNGGEDGAKLVTGFLADAVPELEYRSVPTAVYESPTDISTLILTEIHDWKMSHLGGSEAVSSDALGTRLMCSSGSVKADCLSIPPGPHLFRVDIHSDCGGAVVMLGNESVSFGACGETLVADARCSGDAETILPDAIGLFLTCLNGACEEAVSIPWKMLSRVSLAVGKGGAKGKGKDKAAAVYPSIDPPEAKLQVELSLPRHLIPFVSLTVVDTACGEETPIAGLKSGLLELGSGKEIVLMLCPPPNTPVDPFKWQLRIASEIPLEPKELPTSASCVHFEGPYFANKYARFFADQYSSSALRSCSLWATVDRKRSPLVLTVKNAETREVLCTKRGYGSVVMTGWPPLAGPALLELDFDESKFILPEGYLSDHPSFEAAPAGFGSTEGRETDVTWHVFFCGPDVSVKSDTFALAERVALYTEWETAEPGRSERAEAARRRVLAEAKGEIVERDAEWPTGVTEEEKIELRKRVERSIQLKKRVVLPKVIESDPERSIEQEQLEEEAKSAQEAVLAEEEVWKLRKEAREAEMETREAFLGKTKEERAELLSTFAEAWIPLEEERVAAVQDLKTAAEEHKKAVADSAAEYLEQYSGKGKKGKKK